MGTACPNTCLYAGGDIFPPRSRLIWLSFSSAIATRDPGAGSCEVWGFRASSRNNQLLFVEGLVRRRFLLRNGPRYATFSRRRRPPHRPEIGDPEPIPERGRLSAREHQARLRRSWASRPNRKADLGR